MKTGTFLLLTLLLWVQPSHGETPVSLRDAVVRGLQQNHLLKAAAHQQAAAAQALEAVKSRFWPRIGFEEAGAASNSPTRTFMMKLDQGRFSQQDFQIDNLNSPSVHSDFRTSFTFDIPLFDLSIPRAASVSEEELVSESHNLERRRQEIAQEVYSRWLQVRKAKAYAEVAQQAVRSAEEHLRLAKVRYGAGTGLRSDELRARTFLSEAEQQRLAANNGVTVARLRLAQVMGADLRNPPDIAEDGASLEVVDDLDNLLKQAFGQRQDLKSGEAAVRRADAGVNLARASYLPVLYGSASYQWNDRDIPLGRDNDSWTAGAGLKWEIFDGFRRNSEVARAAALRESAAAALENQRREVVVQVTESMLRRDEAKRRLEVSRHSVEDAEEAVRLVEKRFSSALATMVELLDAQTALNRAKAQLVENEVASADASAAVLGSAGIFLQEVLK